MPVFRGKNRLFLLKTIKRKSKEEKQQQKQKKIRRV